MSKRTTIKKKEKKDKREEKRREAVKYEEKIAVGCRWHTGIFMRGLFILIYIKHRFFFSLPFSAPIGNVWKCEQ